MHNLFHFLRLRADHHAQYEIRAYADVMIDTVKRWVPFAYEAFMEHRHHSVQLSRTALSVVQKLVKGQKVTLAESGLSPREARELEAKIGITLS